MFKLFNKLKAKINESYSAWKKKTCWENRKYPAIS